LNVKELVKNINEKSRKEKLEMLGITKFELLVEYENGYREAEPYDYTNDDYWVTIKEPSTLTNRKNLLPLHSEVTYD